MSSITKDEFLRRCCEKCDSNLTRAQMKDAYDVIMGVARDAIMDQEGIIFHGLGTMTTIIKPSHTARNPATGETVTVPDRVMAKFHINANLKTDLRNVDLAKKKSPAKRRK